MFWSTAFVNLFFLFHTYAKIRSHLPTNAKCIGLYLCRTILLKKNSAIKSTTLSIVKHKATSTGSRQKQLNRTSNYCYTKKTQVSISNHNLFWQGKKPQFSSIFNILFLIYFPDTVTMISPINEALSSKLRTVSVSISVFFIIYPVCKN